MCCSSGTVPASSLGQLSFRFWFFGIGASPNSSADRLSAHSSHQAFEFSRVKVLSGQTRKFRFRTRLQTKLVLSGR
jgi:hypothetical protein